MSKNNQKYKQKAVYVDANRVHQKCGYRCFYTGLAVKKKGKCQTHPASVEHLLSVSMFSRQQMDTIRRRRPETNEMINQFNSDNTVTAALWINGIVGDAPLVVKYALRDYLRSFAVMPNMTLKQEKIMYSNLAKKFLKSYCPEGTRWNYPWGWYNQHGHYNDERAAVLKKLYMDLLTEEEKLLLDYS